MSFMHTQFDPAKHTRYIPKNIDKYLCKEYPICRSSLEEAFCKIVDTDRNVVEWSSEALHIFYMFRGEKRRYFPDYYVRVKTPMIDRKMIIEIKHSHETSPPKSSQKKSRKTILYENLTWQKNLAKWKAAKRWCEKMGYEFRLVTEKDLFKSS